MLRYFTYGLLLLILSASSTAQEIIQNKEINHLNIQEGINWISFPRLERVYNVFQDAIPALERIEPFPEYLKMYDQYDNYIEYDELNGWQIYGLDQVQTTKGYKLDIDYIEGTPPKLNLYGSKIDPATEINLVGNGVENWVGYFVEKSQWPEDCIPQDLWDILLEIKTQTWSMENDCPPDDCWVTDGKITPFQYGQMIIFRTTEPYDFTWIDTGEEAEGEGRPDPEYYSYTEKWDYVPFFIEFDETSDVQEIGVFVNNECKGAAVRETGDTIVEVNGYLEDIPPGATVEFETWNGYKSTPSNKIEYLVWNPNTQIKEKRKIFTGERKRYYVLSFKQGEAYEVPDDISEVSCYPNPFTNETLISFRLNKTINVSVEIYDLNGKRIKTLVQGELQGGYYNFAWKGENESGASVNEGVYFYKIRTDKGSIITNKIVLIN
ncbi:MAG: T9SS type A sorting domain-containing protein [Bacteroidales bacterium]|nr:T9SS type A sorting domain-containing protein [Bacteroidales bacterium]